MHYVYSTIRRSLQTKCTGLRTLEDFAFQYIILASITRCNINHIDMYNEQNFCVYIYIYMYVTII